MGLKAARALLATAAAFLLALAPVVSATTTAYTTGGSSASRDGYLAKARVEVYKSSLEVLAQNQAELQRNIRYNKLVRGDASRREIALTFDDGPHRQFTPKLLEILAKYGVKATFFVVGEMSERAPDLVRAEMAGGHNVGNHTYSHVNLTKVPVQDVLTELRAGTDVLTTITGVRPHLFRPPGGDYDHDVILAAETEGYTTVLWTDDPGDYASPGEALLMTRLLEHVNPGGILLLHDGIQQTIDLLPKLIETLRQKGYTFITVDEMLSQPKR